MSDSIVTPPQEPKPEPDPLPAIMTVIHAGKFLLENSTGHDDYELRKIIYYAIATHCIPQFDFFPILALYGSPSTGKTVTIVILRGLCFRPIIFSAEAITDAALKANMAKAHNATIMIEEGDKISTKDMEGLLITRCYKSSAVIEKMIPVGRSWELSEHAAFGATIIHRRNLFKDAALLRRTIPVKTKRRKKEYSPVPPVYDKALFRLRVKIGAMPRLPVVENTWDIEQGVFDCYKPILFVASYVKDDDFIDKLVKEMGSASERLREEETYLESPCILAAIVAAACEKLGQQFTFERMNVEMQAVKKHLLSLFNSTSPVAQLSPNQRNRIIREDLGLDIRSSHGKVRVYFTILQLIEKCKEYGVKDDVLAEWEISIMELKSKKGQQG